MILLIPVSENEQPSRIESCEFGENSIFKLFTEEGKIIFHRDEQSSEAYDGIYDIVDKSVILVNDEYMNADSQIILRFESSEN